MTVDKINIINQGYKNFLKNSRFMNPKFPQNIMYQSTEIFAIEA